MGRTTKDGGLLSVRRWTPPRYSPSSVQRTPEDGSIHSADHPPRRRAHKIVGRCSLFHLVVVRRNMSRVACEWYHHCLAEIFPCVTTFPSNTWHSTVFSHAPLVSDNRATNSQVSKHPTRPNTTRIQQWVVVVVVVVPTVFVTSLRPTILCVPCPYLDQTSSLTFYEFHRLYCQTRVRKLLSLLDHV